MSGGWRGWIGGIVALCLALCLAVGLAGCGVGGGRTLRVGAFSAARDALAKGAIPAFVADWRARTGEEVSVSQSYQASGAMARAVAGGFEADVVLLSLPGDVDTLVKAGLVEEGWRASPDAAIVATSLVVWAVRPGNPKGVARWEDLMAPGVEVLTPSPKTSGGAMWNLLALVGAVERQQTRFPATQEGATDAVAGLLQNVRIMDRSARESIVSFERGVGDVAITYENEAIVARAAGRAMDVVLPPATIRIENPAAVVDGWVDANGTRDLAEAFLAFLQGEAGQAALAAHGLRPVSGEIPVGVAVAGGPFLSAASADVFPLSSMGAWKEVKERVFGAGGLFDQASLQARR